MATVKDNWQANLIILGKLERGDMLAVAGDDGKLVRKTNWLTQAKNNSKTRGEELFKQIKDVLDSAETNIDETTEDVLIKQYVKANKGLEILLSTYKSKGSKETELIGKLSLVLVEHMKKIEINNNTVEPEKQEMKKYAEQAIQFVNDCRIRSINNNWGNSYFGQEYDSILFQLMVRAASTCPFGIEDSNKTRHHTAKDLQAILATIMIMPCSRKEKKEMLAKKLNDLITDPSGNETNKHGIDWLLKKDVLSFEATKQHKIDHKNQEVAQIKIAKRAIRYRLGTCFDKACVAATDLVENTKGKIGIVRVQGHPYEHAWVLISKDWENLVTAINTCQNQHKPANGNYKHLFPLDTWVVDGWTRDWWQLRAWTNSVCNPRQYLVRRNIRNAIESGLIVGYELVNWPPKYPNQGFRLRFAHLASLDRNIISNKNMTFSSDWHKGVQVLKTMKYEINALGFLD